jgi:hypothetical protein
MMFVSAIAATTANEKNPGVIPVPDNAYAKADLTYDDPPVACKESREVRGAND